MNENRHSELRVDLAISRTCTKCLTEKPLTEFGKHQQCKYGRNSCCKACRKVLSRAQYKANPEKWKRNSARWMSANRERYLKWMRGWRNNWMSVIRDEVISHYGPNCRCCGESNRIFLTIDHVNNDGYLAPRHRRGGSLLYRWLKVHKFPDGFQTLCFNCNQGKHRNGGICPHQAAKERLA